MLIHWTVDGGTISGNYCLREEGRQRPYRVSQVPLNWERCSLCSHSQPSPSCSPVASREYGSYRIITRFPVRYTVRVLYLPSLSYYTVASRHCTHPLVKLNCDRHSIYLLITNCGTVVSVQFPSIVL